MERALVWVRRDLRLSDHVALAEATHQAKNVAVVFVFDTNILKDLEDRDDARVTFIYDSLAEMDETLRSHGSALLVTHGDPMEIIPHLAHELDVEAVFTNGDIDPYALKRDAAVSKALRADGRELKTFKDHVVFSPNEIVADGGPYRVFTPYSRRWLSTFDPKVHAAEHSPNPKHYWPATKLRGHLKKISLKELGFEKSPLWLEPGEKAAHERLEWFIGEPVEDYAEERGFPAIKAVSGLSVHLRFGTVSIREAVRAAIARNGNGAKKWLSELIWRDFYQSILGHFPHVVEEPFQKDFHGITYPGSKHDYVAWERGETGFPIVDAAMRQINETGYMHNRLRMIVASFLTKDLLCDYREGEAYFARKLLDFDLASNNGGWQWAASVGSDPQPYFRIFNPVRQSEKFDPKGEFIRQWIPELAALDDRSIHAPWEAELALDGAGIKLGRDYPKPIVDHATMRPRAISLLAEARERNRAAK